MTSWVGVDTELEEVTFEEGLNEKDIHDFRDAMPSETATRLANKLRFHLDNNKSATYQLPEKSGALIGACSPDNAVEWIARYPERLNPNRVSDDEKKRSRIGDIGSDR